MRILFPVCALVATVRANLPSSVHDAINAHFFNISYGINLYFCSENDALNSFKLAKNHMARRKVLNSNSVPVVDVSTHRTSTFVDSTCSEGIQLVTKNKQQMNVNFRWLIYIENYTKVMETLNASRLEFDSDVTLVTAQAAGAAELLRLTRSYFKLPLTLSDNYTLEDLRNNSKLGSAQVWRGERIDMNGYIFDATIVFLYTKNSHLKNWHLLLNHTVEPSVEDVRRYFAHITLYLMEINNFSLNLNISTVWGEIQADGSFNGSLGQVARRDVEFGLCGIRPYASRTAVVDFTFSTVNSRFNFVLIQPKAFGSPAALIVPFTSTTWVAVLLLVLILIAAMRLTVLSDKSQLHNDSWGGSMILVVGGISQCGIPDSPSTLSSRSTYFVVLTSLFFVFSYYSTSVLNGLILPTPNAIQNIDQLLASSTILSAVDVAYVRREIVKTDPRTEEVKSKMIKERFISVEDGLERVKKGRFALYGLDIPLRTQMRAHLTEAQQCLVTEIPMMRKFPLSFFLPKRSPFMEMVNRGLLKMMERGIYSYLQDYWLAQLPKCVTSLDFIPIAVEGMTLAYSVLAVGLIVSLNIVVLELWIKKKMKQSAANQLPVFGL